MAQLKGSEKQIEWANKIRIEAIERATNHLATNEKFGRFGEEARQLITQVILAAYETKVHASWWINFRQDLWCPIYVECTPAIAAIVKAAIVKAKAAA